MAGHGSPPPPNRAHDPARRVDRASHIEADDAYEAPEVQGTVQTSGWDAAESNPQRIGPYSF